MQKDHPRRASMCQQIKALLWKNIIVKWRMKTQSFQEWFSSLMLLWGILMIPVFHGLEPIHDIPWGELGKLDDIPFNVTAHTIAYTPGTKTARAIMEKVEKVSVLKGIRTELVEDEEAIEEAHDKDDGVIGVIFRDDFSYRLRFEPTEAPFPNDYIASIAGW